MEGAGCDEQDMVGLHRPIFGGDRGALDQRQKIPLHALAGNAPPAHVGNGNFIDLVQEHDAVGFRILHRLARQVVGVQPLVALLVHQQFPGVLNRHLAPLRPLRPHALQHLAQVDHLHASGLAGNLERQAAAGILHLDIHFPALQLAGEHPVAEGQACRLAGVLAHQRVQQPVQRGGFRGIAHARPLQVAGQADGFLHQVADDGIHVAAHIAHLGELGGLDLQERRLGQLRQPAGDLGFPAARRPDHQDVLRRHLVAQLGRQLLATPAVPQRHGHRLLRLGLAHDMAVQRSHDGLGGQRRNACDFRIHDCIHQRDSTVRLLLVYTQMSAEIPIALRAMASASASVSISARAAASA